MSLLLTILATAASPAPQSERVAANVDRARRAMGYVWCLYGTKEPDGIVGLPAEKRYRQKFVTTRMAECEAARHEAELAFLETRLVALEAGALPGETPDEQRALVARDLASIDSAFIRNALDPEGSEARVREFEKCMQSKGSSVEC